MIRKLSQSLSDPTQRTEPPRSVSTIPLLVVFLRHAIRRPCPSLLPIRSHPNPMYPSPCNARNLPVPFQLYHPVLIYSVCLLLLPLILFKILLLKIFRPERNMLPLFQPTIRKIPHPMSLLSQKLLKQQQRGRKHLPHLHWSKLLF